MGDNVVSLKGAKVIPPGTPRPELVATLEELLEMARAGQLDGIACSLLFHDDCTSFRVSGRANRGLIGVISMMQFQLLYDDMKAD